MSEELKDILVVEDDLDIQEIEKLSLSSVGGYSTTICGSGAEALKLLEQQIPQLVLLDVAMPEMDGPTILKIMRLSPKLAKIPVIFLTAKVQTKEIEEYEKMGVLGIISKPFDPMTLSETILEMWKNHKSSNL